MLRELLDQTILFCPACRRVEDGTYRDSPVRLAEAFEEEDGWILSGFLVCRDCDSRYPVIDGIPVLMTDPGEYLKTMEDAILWRRDLPPALTDFVYSHYAEDTVPGWRRQLIAIYATSLAPPPETEDELGQLLRETALRSRAFLAKREAAALDGRESPLVLDAGCGVGASSFSLAGSGARVVALDRDFGTLSVLSRLLRKGRVTLPAWRHGGDDFVETELLAPAPGAGRILPVAGDALAPPVAARAFDVAVSYNLVDNVSQPVVLIRQLHAVLKAGGTLLLTTPYDWAARCTAPEARFGDGISPDGEVDPAAVMRKLLEGGLPEVAPEVRLAIREEVESLPWVIRRHRRSQHVFACHFVAAMKVDAP